jgi:hypothetical protein
MEQDRKKQPKRGELVLPALALAAVLTAGLGVTGCKQPTDSENGTAQEQQAPWGAEVLGVIGNWQYRTLTAVTAAKTGTGEKYKVQTGAQSRTDDSETKTVTREVSNEKFTIPAGQKLNPDGTFGSLENTGTQALTLPAAAGISGNGINVLGIMQSSHGSTDVYTVSNAVACSTIDSTLAGLYRQAADLSVWLDGAVTAANAANETGLSGKFAALKSAGGCDKGAYGQRKQHQRYQPVNGF